MSELSFPKSVNIADVQIAPNLVLAPMEGVTDLVFRRLIRKIGGTGLTCTEFIASEGLKRGVGKMIQMASFDPDERPVSVQIYGRNPDVMAEAAQIVEDLGATICDINMGCPSKKVVAHSGGSGLMREPALVTEIVRAVRAAVSIPVTVKMRSGFDHTDRNAPLIARICQEEGADSVAIHWRTRTDKYGGERAVDKIAETKSLLRIPVFANGDVTDVESAFRMFRETGCDGLLIGRGAMRNPWIFRQIQSAMRGETPMVVDANTRRDVLLSFLDEVSENVHSEKGALGRFKQVANYFTRGVPHGSQFRMKVLRAQKIDDVRVIVNRFFDQLVAFEADKKDVFSNPEESVCHPGV